MINNNTIFCDNGKCTIGDTFTLAKSSKTLLKVAKDCGWLVKNSKHYCDKCKSEVNSET